MGLSPRAARRRERLILWHVLIISCLLLLGLWGAFGVIPLPSLLTRSHWYRVYGSSSDPIERADALRALASESDARARDLFLHAWNHGSDGERIIAGDWLSDHRVPGFENIERNPPRKCW